ncbi:Ig-like domain-containing protein [Dehalobacter restrictus]|uniref:BIG2 domain-containing protein n=1 Tax=Dehalobacter restrictus (strain DSM 9455 / PER-K23) TaxID=871738 RepID=A0ABM5P9F7_DEHRP|nr:Ig-like domain-containing protein [Dehalobacter restrictus]AHF11387.1 hypothetical protein DEHRE_09825 [Dehalobacter restrictus DSM 9455]
MILKKALAVLLTVSQILLTFSSASLAGLDDASNNTVFVYDDDFSGYATGSDGMPNWVTNGFSWVINDGYFKNDLVKKSFALLNSPTGAEVSFESEVMIKSSNGDKYKIAGIAVYTDHENYWHLALVEAPDKNTHYVELEEMINGKWCAESRGDTKLETGTLQPGGLHWDYNHPYRLKITLNELSITGAVYELDGSLIWKTKYLFKPDNCVKTGIPSLTTAAFEAQFDNVKVNITKTVADENPNTSLDDIKVTNIKISPEELFIKVGQTRKLEALIIPTNASNKTINWTSDNPQIASVNDGVVKGLSPGTVFIRVSTEDKSISDTCKVTVTSFSVYLFVGLYVLIVGIIALLIFRYIRTKEKI